MFMGFQLPILMLGQPIFTVFTKIPGSTSSIPQYARHPGVLAGPMLKISFSPLISSCGLTNGCAKIPFISEENIKVSFLRE